MISHEGNSKSKRKRKSNTENGHLIVDHEDLILGLRTITTCGFCFCFCFFYTLEPQSLPRAFIEAVSLDFTV